MGKSHLHPATKKAIADLVFRDEVNPYECVRTGYTLEQEIDTIRVGEAQLSDRDADLLVQASDQCHCGATGNCAFWILHRQAGGLKTLLATHMVQMFSVEETRSRGYKDLMTSTSGVSLRDLVLYRFDGKRYHATQCANAEYHFDDDGKPIGEPTITPAKECDIE